MVAKGTKYDFIVVGGGPSGCAVAARLAGSAKGPNVLLIEAGGTNGDKRLRIDSERWTTFMSPSMNWGYKTTPQPGLNDRELEYTRGKGLGGSSSINFSVYDIGPKDDFEEIARLAGDESWNWEHAQTRFKNLETFHGEAPTPYENYIRAKPEDHGSAGKLHIGFPKIWEKTMGDLMKSLEDSGCDLIPDVNCGNPVGWGACPSSAYNGLRTTSADLVLNSPENLKIITEQAVRQVLFEGTTAIGIETEEASYYATKEVILSCGSLDTPKLLMLSGVGPADELAKLQIRLIQDLKNVGKNLRDHCHVAMLLRRAENTSEKWKYYRNPEAIAASRLQWDKDQTGPLAQYNANFPIGFLKNEQIYGSAEFESLPEKVKTHLKASTVPLFENILGPVDVRDMMDPTQSEASMAAYVFLLNGQSRGQVTLRSKDPADPPVSNPNFFSHPFDRKVAIEATRETMRLIHSPAFAKDTTGVIELPKSDSDEDILVFWREHASSTWHMTGTVKMGQSDDEDACVDKDLRVFGTTSLRVADMSISPILPNNHTQTTAYYIGATAGDKLAAEYNLD